MGRRPDGRKEIKEKWIIQFEKKGEKLEEEEEDVALLKYASEYYLLIDEGGIRCCRRVRIGIA